MSTVDLVGYDVRVGFERLRALWPDVRKVQYLIDANIDYPLSVDFLAWPSIFDNKEIGVGLADDHKCKLGLGDVPIPPWVGVHFPFWDNLEQLRKDIGVQQGNLCQVIMVYRIKGDLNHNALERHFESVVKEEWEWKGFDVADTGFNSIVTNSSSPIIDGKLKRSWAQKLNSNGLFIDAIEALRWSQTVSNLVPELFPLNVYSLYCLRSRPRKFFSVKCFCI